METNDLIIHNNPDTKHNVIGSDVQKKHLASKIGFFSPCIRNRLRFFKLKYKDIKEPPD